MFTALAAITFIYVSSPDCIHCQRLKPEMDKLRAAATVVDVDGRTDRIYRVGSFPTIIVMRGEKEVARYNGWMYEGDKLVPLTAERLLKLHPK